MKKGWIIVAALFIIIVLGVLALTLIPGPNIANAPSNNGSATTTNTTTTPGEGSKPAGIPDLISVSAPVKDQKVSSPLTVTGSARGTWYFEASFPIELKNSSGTIIAQGHGEAQGDWMTEDFVTFKATLSFPAQPAGSVGTLVLKNDNPSGDPARQKEVDIPVTF